jgi:serine/threonine kinase 16
MTTLMAIRDTIYALTSCCFPNPIIAVGKQKFKVISLLGEGYIIYKQYSINCT